MQNNRPGRLAVAFALVALVVAFGLSVPLVLDGDLGEFNLSNVSVFAAPRGGHEIGSPVDLSPTLRLRLNSGTVALDASDGDAADTSGALPRDGTANLIIEDGVFQIAGGERADPAPLSGPAAPFIEAVQTLNFGTLLIRRSTVAVALPDGRVEQLTDVNGEVRPNRRNSISIRGSGRLRGREITFDLSTASIPQNEAGSRVPTKLRLESPLLNISFDGKVGASDTLHIQGRIELGMEDVRKTARWLGAAWPSGLGLKNAAVSGDLDWQKPGLAFDKATFRLDGNEATGTLTLSFAGERPALTGTLDMQSLDLSPYIPDPIEGLTFSELLARARADQSSLSMPLAHSLDADVRLSAAQLLVGGMTFGRFAASLSLKKGQLLADIAEIGIDGTGRASGQLTATLARDPLQIGMRARLEDIDAARASMALIGQSHVQGLSTIAMDFASEGNSPAELLDQIRGKIVLSLNEGGRLGIDLKALQDDAAKGGELEGWGRALSGQTSVDNLEARLRVGGGVIESELVEATVGSRLLKAIGTISLESQNVNLRVILGALPEAAEGAVSAPADVLVFRGPWAAPSITIER